MENLLVLHLLLCAFPILFINPGSGKCIEEERQALLDFKKGLKDDDDLLSSWKIDDQYCCRWRGIECHNRTAHVISLDLRPNFIESESVGSYWSPLEGELRPSLLQLPSLKHLDFSLNYFSAIPAFMGSLSRLRYLNFSGNWMSGHIPSQLGNLSRLRSLDLSSNNFIGDVPRELGNLYSLRYLYLTSNLGILTVDNFEWLSRLSSLRELQISQVDFTGARNWLQSVRSSPSLSSIHMIGSQFSEVDPASLSRASSSNSLKLISFTGCSIHSSTLPLLISISNAVVDLRLSNSQLKGPIPDIFSSLDSLQNLDLSWNELEGPIPKSLGNLCNLQTLDLSKNNLSEPIHGILESLAGCARTLLRIIDLSNNKLKGALQNITSFMSLKELHLDSNQLEGFSSNSTFGPSSQIAVLNLANKRLTGAVPVSIRELSNLSVLLLQSNKLVGDISEVHFQNLFNLRILDLSFNSLALNLSSDWVPPSQLISINLRSCKLGPRFPAWLRRQTNFSKLDISSSGISETVPSWFWNNLPQKLRYLNISYNSLSGKVPNLRYKFAYPPSFDLSSNLFYGSIPQFLSKATVLILSNNNFSGSLSFLCSFNNNDLSYLDLADNSLSGKLPDCWMNMRNLAIVDLGNNNFSGLVPGTIGSLEQIQSLRLRNNSFSGGLPTSLNNCPMLKLLDLGENKLTGPIPAWLGQNLTGLVVLRLQGNKFYGQIPEAICRLASLQLLDLSMNNIFGAIPHCISNITAMTNNIGSEPWRGALSYLYYYTDISFNDNGPQAIKYGSEYEDSSWVTWKGGNREYKNNLGLLKMIDLSSNALSGEIPAEMASLVGLLALNLSSNRLTGRIPKDIGQLERLESFDLSRNHLSGEIPRSLATLTFLSVLDLSSNNLSGEIPSSTQLQGFNVTSYAGNSELCGLPLPNKCPGRCSKNLPPEIAEDGGNNDKWYETVWFYSGVAVGFLTSFWAVFGTLVVKRSARARFFHLLENISDWMYLKIALKWASR